MQLDNIPDDIYKLMLDCWQKHARSRPNFQFLSKFFISRLSIDGAKVNDENSDNDEAEKHSNTVYV